MEIKVNAIIKIGLIILLLLCLLPMPYVFFNLVRFCALIGFGILAYTAYNEKRTPLMIAYISLAILFQPFEKIALGRAVWNFVDVAVALFLIVLLIKNNEISIKK